MDEFQEAEFEEVFMFIDDEKAKARRAVRRKATAHHKQSNRNMLKAICGDACPKKANRLNIDNANRKRISAWYWLDNGRRKPMDSDDVAEFNYWILRNEFDNLVRKEMNA